MLLLWQCICSFGMSLDIPIRMLVAHVVHLLCWVLDVEFISKAGKQLQIVAFSFFLVSAETHGLVQL